MGTFEIALIAFWDIWGRSGVTLVFLRSLSDRFGNYFRSL